MKLVQINSVYNTGSTGRIVEGIAQAARRREHDTQAVYGRRSGSGPTESYRISFLPDQLVHGVYSYAADAHCLGSRRATRRLVNWLDKEKPDIVGLHNLHGYYLNVPMLFECLRRTGIPVVWTLHDCWAFTGHCSYFDRFDCRKWQSECHDCPMTRYYPRSLVDRSTRNHKWKKRAFSGLDNLTLVTPSRWLAEHVAESFLAEYPVRVIPNGIDLERFRPVGPARSDSVTILGVANGWDDRKGLADFIRLRALLPRKWRIVLVGLSRSQARALPDGIEGLERTESIDELVGLYSQAAVYVNPTWSDNFPTTNLEALACGTPVVTYRTGGSPESVREGCGAVVEQGNVDGLAAAVRSLVKADGDELSPRCRAVAEAEYDRDFRFEEYVRLCEQIAIPASRAAGTRPVAIQNPQ